MRLKKIIALVLCICFIVSFCGNGFCTLSENVVKDKNMSVVKNDEKLCTVKAEYKGDELYATLNKETNKITMKSVESTKIFGLEIGKSEENNYNVKLDKAVDGEISGVVIDNKTNKEFKISEKSKSDKVTAQAPIVIPLIEILGESLIAYLLLIASSVVIAGATYYLASEIADELRDNKKYDYYMAAIKNSKLYFGPGMNYTAAFAEVEANLDVFCKSKDLARQLASNAGGMARGPEKSKAEGSFWHYHPKYGPSGAHVFY